jgi:hypothetical protein
MVTDAQWADMNGDGKKELIMVGDWMPVTIFGYQQNKFVKTITIPHSSGWWNSIIVDVLNNDGKPDIVAGNFGLNSNIKADQTHPAKLYIADFDKNGQTECIPVYFKNDGKAYPYYLKDEMESQIPSLKKKFLRYDSYAGKPIGEIFSSEQLNQATMLSVEQTQSAVFMNDGKEQFTMQNLPVMAQLSPVYGIAICDINGDGKKDIFMGGNFHGLKPQTGRLDASYGTTLISNAMGGYTYIKPKESGLFVKGELRDIALIKSARGEGLIIVSMNNDQLHLFRKTQ